MTVRLSRLAVGDLAETRDHHRAIGKNLEHRFLDQLDLVIDRLLSFPNGAAPDRQLSRLRARAVVRSLIMVVVASKPPPTRA